MEVESLNSDTVTLIRPNGATNVKVTPAADGILLFATSREDLLPGANYTLFTNGARSAAGQALPFAPLAFTTITLHSTDVANGQSASSSASPSTLKSAPGSAETVASSSVDPSSRHTHANTATSAPASQASSKSGKGADTPPKEPPAKPTISAAHTGTATGPERWIPTAKDYHGCWRSGQKRLAGQSPPQNDLLNRALYGNPEVLAVMKKLTPVMVKSGMLKTLVPADRLHGPAGVTAVTGQALRLNGQPLRGVTLSIGKRSTRTDDNGELTLAGVDSGHQILVIDGATANSKDHHYGRYEYGLTVNSGQTTALPFILWMTALDTEHASTCSDESDPADCSTGLFVDDEIDLQVADVVPIEVHRTYRQSDNISRGFGVGTNISYDAFLVGSNGLMTPGTTGYGYDYQDLILPDGFHVHFDRTSPGSSTQDAVYQATSTPSRYAGAIIKYTGGIGTVWTLTLQDGTTYGFGDSDASMSARQAAITSIVDRNGNTTTLTRDANYNLTTIKSPNGRQITLTYDEWNRVTQPRMT